MIERLQELFRRRGHTPAEAQDLTQETAARLLAVQSAVTVQQPEALLFRIAKNVSVDLIRETRDRGEHVDLDEEEIVDPGPSVEQIVADRERLDLVRSRLPRLTAREREIMYGIKLNGKSRQEMAERLDLSLSAIDKHLADAVTKLADDEGDGR